MLPRAIMRLPALTQPLRATFPATQTHPACLAHRPVSARNISTHALSAEDKLEIMELCYKFDTALNTHDTELALDLFAKEAKLQSPKGTVVGQQALREYLKAIEGMAKGNRHLTANIVVQGGNERAHASSCRLLHRASSPPALLATGTIEDTLVKLDGEWKFQERRFIMDPPVHTN